MPRVSLEFAVLAEGSDGEFIVRWPPQGPTVFAGAGYSLQTAIQAIAKEAVNRFIRESTSNDFIHPSSMISEAHLPVLELPI